MKTTLRKMHSKKKKCSFGVYNGLNIKSNIDQLVDDLLSELTIANKSNVQDEIFIKIFKKKIYKPILDNQNNIDFFINKLSNRDTKTDFKKMIRDIKNQPSSFGKCKIGSVKRRSGGMYILKKVKGVKKWVKVSSKRKSPAQSATSYRVGTTKKGLDRKMWVVKKTRTGVKRWVKKIK